jgi:biopolymer transport protein ExbD
VVLVLLIVLMVAASQAVSRALPVELPQASSGEQATKTPLSITVDATGALFLDGEPISKDALRARLGQEREARERGALIAADGEVSHRVVVAVIDVLRSVGITRFGINVSPAELSP